MALRPLLFEAGTVSSAAARRNGAMSTGAEAVKSHDDPQALQGASTVAEKRLTGRIAAEHIRMIAVPRPPQGAVERLIALGDPTGIISDTMDELGIPCGVIGASVLRPTIPGSTMVGPALTLRNIVQRIDPLQGARDHVNKMAEFEAHNLAQ